MTQNLTDQKEEENKTTFDGIGPKIEFEDEAKAQLNEKDFNFLVETFNLNSMPPVIQRNDYFDNSKGELRALTKGNTLRCRKKGDSKVLQLKLRQGGRAPESKTTLNEDTSSALFKSGIIPDGDVKMVLHDLEVSGPFVNIANCITFRLEFKSKHWPDVTLFLDACLFANGKKDYELEIESSISVAHAFETRDALLGKYNITVIESDFKVERAIANMK